MALKYRCLLRVSFYECYCVADSFDFFCFFVGDGYAEFFLEVHDEFNGIERICTEVGDERCGFCYLVGLNTEFINYDAFNAICYFRYNSEIIL